MEVINNLRVRYKAAIMIIIATIGMITVGYTGYTYLYKSQLAMEAIYSNNLQAVQHLSKAIVDTRVVQSRTLQTVIETKPEKLAQRKDDFLKFSKNYEGEWEAYTKIASPAGKEKLAAAQSHWNDYKATMMDIINLSLQGKKEEAAALYETKGASTMIAIRDNLNELQKIEDSSAKAINENNKQDSKSALHNMIIKTVLVFIVLLVFCLWFVKQIITPLNDMIHTCKKLSDGDYRIDGQTSVRGDEFGDMERMLWQMQESLIKFLHRMNDSIEHVAASSEELTASSMQSAQAATDVAKSAEKASSLVEEHKVSVTRGRSSVNEVNISIQNIHKESDTVVGYAHSVVNYVTEGNGVIDKSVTKIKTVENTVSSSTDMVETLGDSSQAIGQIIETISSIAGQTNLLALNAAIEAARAGENGKGFAVVAEEVRKLAEQSQTAAAQITELISKIQSDTANAVTAMQRGRSEVAEGAKSVEELRSMFSKIDGLINNVTQQVDKMAQAVNKVTQNAASISREVDNIDTDSNKVAGEIQTVSATMQHQSATTEEIASASEALAQLAQETQEELHKFKF